MKFKIPRHLQRALGTAAAGLVIYLFTWFYQAVTYVPIPVEDGDILLYSNQTQQDLSKTFKRAIESADQSILLMIYSLRDKELIRLLKEKASQGIEVQVICDPEASRGLRKKLGDAINTYYRYDDGIMHLKVLVIDEESIWLGSANLTHSSLKVHGNLVMGVHSERMAHRFMARAERMIAKRDVDLTQPQEFNIGGQEIELYILPQKQALTRLLQLIQSAEKTVKVAMFTWTHPKLTEAVIDAHQRGVEVDIVLDYDSSQGASLPTYKRLREGGVPLLLSHRSGLLHHKMMIVDDHTLVNGSANWTRSAFTRNDDCFMIIHPLKEEQRKLLDRLWYVITAETIEP